MSKATFINKQIAWHFPVTADQGCVDKLGAKKSGRLLLNLTKVRQISILGEICCNLSSSFAPNTEKSTGTPAH